MDRINEIREDITHLRLDTHRLQTENNCFWFMMGIVIVVSFIIAFI